MRKNRHSLFSVLMTLAALLFLITASVSVLLWASVPLYDLAIRLLKIPEATGYAAEICHRNYQVLANYLSLWGRKTLAFPDFPMSEAGEIHFGDVRQILFTVQAMALVGLPVLIFGYREGKKLRCLDWLRTTVTLAASLLAAIIAGVVIDRTGTFILFHKLFFTNNYWQFDPAKDPVICILTEEVFLGAAIFIFLLMALGSGIYLRLRNKGEKKRNRNGKALLSHGKKLHREGHH